ncbi:sodium:proline symporter [Halomonas sp. LBP4]|uniref:sodium:proline symporter n=1 Tax=Halomonas sp. LBP4 TaxID=2044917 RepID=UPI000D775D0A|nr:sodium:proline symporter [Halomonas sp. LBP4]PXX95584.1 sodium:proline symporter [Halomonas sp. LBP4]
MRSIDWRAAIGAGIAAGIVATAIQVVLWEAFGHPLPEILYRDARFAAAIVLGREVLPPPASFAAPVFAVATLVHFALSIAYGVAIAMLVVRRRLLPGLIVGMLFGAALFAVNLYGFTVAFPWFAAVRDPITFAAHLAFGATAALTYRLCRSP